MKVEINKKHVVIIAIAFALVAISFISGYFIGTESAKKVMENTFIVKFKMQVELTTIF